MTISEPLFTEDEHRAMELTGELATLIGKIIRAPHDELAHDDGRRAMFSAIADNDWAEAAMDIHRIQHRIMAQAAARAFPTQYRLMGRTIQ